METSNRMTNIYEWNHLPYGGDDTPDDVYDMDDADDIADWRGPKGHECSALPSVQCGYQDRCALRGTHGGVRSEEATNRLFQGWKSRQIKSRRDSRPWKSSYKDSTLRTHGDQNPKPLICPKPAVSMSFQSKAKQDHINRLRNCNKIVALPLPTSFDLTIAT